MYSTTNDSELCGHCNKPLGSDGAWYWDRVRICHDCWEYASCDAWQQTNQELAEFARGARRVKWIVLTGIATVAIATAYSVFHGWL